METGMETARMTLRPMTVGDAGLLFELDGDPEVMRWLSGGPGTPMEAIEGRILPAMLAIAGDSDGHGAWIARTKPDGTFAGWFTLRSGPADGESEVGYRLKREVWGKGLATEGVVALLERAFGEMERRRVFGTTYEENVGSRRVMEKCGMRHVRSFQLPPAEPHGRTFETPAESEPWDGDEVEYAITRDEWLAWRR